MTYMQPENKVSGQQRAPLGLLHGLRNRIPHLLVVRDGEICQE